MYEELTHCILFNGLTETQIESKFSGIEVSEKQYTKDELIATYDEECRNLLIVMEGSVKGEMVDFSGKTIKIEDIESVRMLAPAFMFGQNNRYPVSIVANNEVRILSISRDNFLSLLMSEKRILTNYLNSISNRAQFLSNKIRFLSFQTIKGKIAHYLLQVRQKTQSDRFVLPKSHNELSELFGVARPSLSRAMSELAKDGYIHTDGKMIEIADKVGLSSLLKD
ncbi:MAG: Crp/Fnr family transcriptional regulator [Bacteroidota bacterium]|nr:MAG: Crp/Fnr family transcriptional regulator [Bacteroidota bacterium]